MSTPINLEMTDAIAELLRHEPREIHVPPPKKVTLTHADLRNPSISTEDIVMAGLWRHLNSHPEIEYVTIAGETFRVVRSSDAS